MIFRGERRRIVVSAGLIVALLLASAVVIPLFRPARAFSLVDQTTLIVLKGRVEVASAGATAFTTAATNTGLRVGDRVRTGPDGYGVVTYFDGSTTTLDPDTEVVIRRLDKLPGGGASISYHQEIGSSWNRVEKLIGPTSRFESTTAASTAYVRGTEYRIRVSPERRTVVEAVTEAVIVEAVVEGVVFVVSLEPGFETSVDPGEQPTTPVPAPPPRFGFRLDVQGAVSFFLTDQNNRSVGYHPEADAFANQVPGARYSVGGGRQRLDLPDPVAAYELAFKAQGEGGAYSASIVTLLDGEPIASRAPGLARALFQGQAVAGILGRDEGSDRTTVTFDPQRGARLGSLVRRGGFEVPEGSQVALTERQLGLAPEELAAGGALVILCHRRGDESFETLSVGSEALADHLGHGDVFPPCPASGQAAPPAGAVMAAATAALAPPTATRVPPTPAPPRTATPTPAALREGAPGEMPTSTLAPISAPSDLPEAIRTARALRGEATFLTPTSAALPREFLPAFVTPDLKPEEFPSIPLPSDALPLDPRRATPTPAPVPPSVTPDLKPEEISPIFVPPGELPPGELFFTPTPRELLQAPSPTPGAAFFATPTPTKPPEVIALPTATHELLSTPILGTTPTLPPASPTPKPTEPRSLTSPTPTPAATKPPTATPTPDPLKVTPSLTISG